MSEDNLKNEQKLLPERLPSFKGLRDLTLGSATAGKLGVGLSTSRDKQRKLFTPNVNVQRKRNQEIKVKNEFSKSTDKSFRGSRGRGQGRGRNTANLVQASGSVFSEGIAVSATVSRRQNYDTDRVKDEVLQIPKLNLKQNIKVDRDEEDRKLKELLRDDFLDDGDLAPDTAFAPVSLPLINRIKKVEAVDLKPKVKEEKEMIIDGIRIKQEVVETPESDTNGGLDLKLDVDPNLVKKDPQASESHPPENITNLFNSLVYNEKKLILIQFPDRLPALPIELPEDSERPSSSTTTKPKPGQKLINQENNEGSKYCCVSDLAPGHIGHLQIRKSGKIELVLGKCVLNVTQGTNVGFQQDLLAVELHPGNQCTGETVELGPVESRLICTPDWTTLLESSGNT